MSLEQHVRDLNTLIAERRILEAFDKYYADDVVMQEAGAEPRVGGEVNRAGETAFVNGLKSYDVRLLSSAVDEERGVALNEWDFRYEHEAWGRVEAKQVAVQQWRDGRIVRESFYKL